MIAGNCTLKDTALHDRRLDLEHHRCENKPHNAYIITETQIVFNVETKRVKNSKYFVPCSLFLTVK